MWEEHEVRHNYPKRIGVCKFMDGTYEVYPNHADIPPAVAYVLDEGQDKRDITDYKFFALGGKTVLITFNHTEKKAFVTLLEEDRKDVITDNQ